MKNVMDESMATPIASNTNINHVEKEKEKGKKTKKKDTAAIASASYIATLLVKRNFDLPSDLRPVMRALKIEEIAGYLINYERHSQWFSSTVKELSPAGSLLLYNRSLVNFRRDGYQWKTRRKTVFPREDHVQLRINGLKCIYGCYCHAEDNDLHRRSYWLFSQPNIVLVHYINIPNKSHSKAESAEGSEKRERDNLVDEEKRVQVLEMQTLKQQHQHLQTIIQYQMKHIAALSAKRPPVNVPCHEYDSQWCNAVEGCEQQSLCHHVLRNDTSPDLDSIMGWNSASIATDIDTCGSEQLGWAALSPNTMVMLTSSSTHEHDEVTSDMSGRASLDSLAHTAEYGPDDIMDVCPDWAFENIETKIIIVANCVIVGEVYGAVFGQHSVKAEAVAPGVLRCFCPVTLSGTVSLCIVLKNVPISNVVRFQFVKQQPVQHVPSQLAPSNDWLMFQDVGFLSSLISRMGVLRNLVITVARTGLYVAFMSLEKGSSLYTDRNAKEEMQLVYARRVVELASAIIDEGNRWANDDDSLILNLDPTERDLLTAFDHIEIMLRKLRRVNRSPRVGKSNRKFSLESITMIVQRALKMSYSQEQEYVKTKEDLISLYDSDLLEWTTDKRGLTLLHIACTLDMRVLVDRFCSWHLDHGAFGDADADSDEDMDDEESYYSEENHETVSRTSAISCSKNYNYAIDICMKLLNSLSRNLDVRQGDIYDCTPFMWACALGRLGSAEVLLDYETHLGDSERLSTIHDIWGRAPLNVARINGYTEVASILQGVIDNIHSQLVDYYQLQDIAMGCSTNASSNGNYSPDKRRSLAEDHPGDPVLQSSVFEDHMTDQSAISSSSSTTSSAPVARHEVPHFWTDFVTGSGAYALEKGFASMGIESKEEHSDPLELYNAACVVQRFFKRFQDKRELERVVNAVVRIQATYRTHKKRKLYNETKLAAVRIQKHFRQYKQTQRSEAASVIQSAFRSHHARQQATLQREAAQKIQRFVRSKRKSISGPCSKHNSFYTSGTAGKGIFSTALNQSSNLFTTAVEAAAKDKYENI